MNKHLALNGIALLPDTGQSLSLSSIIQRERSCNYCLTNSCSVGFRHFCNGQLLRVLCVAVQEQELESSWCFAFLDEVIRHSKKA